jgi:hypothetical protein
MVPSLVPKNIREPTHFAEKKVCPSSLFEIVKKKTPEGPQKMSFQKIKKQLGKKFARKKKRTQIARDFSACYICTAS